MEVIKQMAKRARELSIDLIMRSIFEDEPDFKDLVIDLNTKHQLFEGVDSKNVTLSSIGGGYAPVTISFKRTNNQPFDRVTLKDTGAFYRSFNVRYEMGGIVIDADTVKDGEDLRERWGNDILGLNNESIEKLIFFLHPLIVEFIHDYLTQDL